ncbi:MAG TPA: hypothetical protein VGM39_26180 [Kofleriaceae bacterium]|jgi:hypothetical protein
MLFTRYEWSWDTRRQDINNLIDATNTQEDLLQQIAQRFDYVERAMERLQATVTVQQQMLAEAGQLDPAKVDARVEAEIQRLRTPPPRPVPVDSSAQVTSLIRCIRCKREVPANTTIMTGNGPMCDPGCAP